MKKVYLLFLMALFGAVVVACNSSGGNSNPDETAVDFVSAMYNGNTDKAIGLLYIPDENRQAAGIEEIVEGKVTMAASQAMQEAESKGGVKTIEVIKSDIEEDKGAITVEITFKDNDEKPNTDRVRVIKVDGKWLVKL